MPIRVLPDASTPFKLAAQAGASALRGGSEWVHQEGVQFFDSHSFSFGPSQPVQQPVQGLVLFMEAPMNTSFRCSGASTRPTPYPARFWRP